MIAASVVLAGGCGSTEGNGSPVDSPPPSPPPTEGSLTEGTPDTGGLGGLGGRDGPVVYGAVREDGEEALGSGTVELDGDCLFLGGTAAPGARPVLVWQNGTRWDDPTSSVVLPGGTSVGIGQQIAAGGGFHGTIDLERFIGDSAAEQRVRACTEFEGSDSVFVIQHPVEVQRATSSTQAQTPPDPNLVEWLIPSESPDGLRLVGAERDLVIDCPLMADCAGEPTLPQATLSYDTNDLSRRRSLEIIQTGRSVSGVGSRSEIVDGDERQLGGRHVLALDESSEAIPWIAAEWTEPDGNFVRVVATGLQWDELDAIVSGLRLAEPSGWPGAPIEERLHLCVDADSRFAPTAVPDGWNRFVLDIQPTGSCDVATILAMSLVEPGTESTPGTLVTIVVAPITQASGTSGEQVVVNGHDAVLTRDQPINGKQAHSISFAVGPVWINAHGDVDAETLQAIAATIAPVDDAFWAALVAEAAGQA